MLRRSGGGGGGGGHTKNEGKSQKVKNEKSERRICIKRRRDKEGGKKRGKKMRQDNPLDKRIPPLSPPLSPSLSPPLSPHLMLLLVLVSRERGKLSPDPVCLSQPKLDSCDVLRVFPLISLSPHLPLPFSSFPFVFFPSSRHRLQHRPSKN